MNTRLFPPGGVLLPAEHPLAASSHAASMREVLDGTTPRPALWLAGDHGAVLMSNGRITAADTGHAAGLPAVYAAGYRTQTAWPAVADQIGRGPEIRTVMALLDPSPGQRIRQRVLTGGAGAGATAFAIDLGPRHLPWHLPGAEITEATR